VCVSKNIIANIVKKENIGEIKIIDKIYIFRSLCTAPPPAIAVTVVIATKDDLQRYGRVTHQV